MISRATDYENGILRGTAVFPGSLLVKKTSRSWQEVGLLALWVWSYAGLLWVFNILRHVEQRFRKRRPPVAPNPSQK
jgi:hypothetical protein